MATNLSGRRKINLQQNLINVGVYVGMAMGMGAFFHLNSETKKNR